MTELPTAAEPSTTHNPKVAHALARIEAAKLTADPNVAGFLEAVADLIRESGDPDEVFAWVLDILGRKHLERFASRNRITLHVSRAADEERLTKAVIIWAADGTGVALVPEGQKSAATLVQLREEIAERDEDVQRALDFQASLAEGLVEDVEAWHARTSKATR